MNKIVRFDSFSHMAEMKRGEDMYEELVGQLEVAPANKYVVREAECLADKVLEINGCVGKSAPTPVVRIAKDFGIATYITKNMPENISGNIFIGGSTKNDYEYDKVIVVGSEEPIQHQRFIIAHELAHYLLDYLGNKEFIGKEHTFSRTYPKVNHDSIEEIRADRFAAELLMPRKVFLVEYVKAMKKSNYSKEYTIPYLAKLFNVKESCIKRRIREVFE